MGCSFCVCASLLVLWRRVVAPSLPMYSTRTAEQMVFLSNSFVSLYPALTAPLLAFAAIRELPLSDERVLAVAPPVAALRAVGLSCGYMLYDLMFILWHAQLRSPLLIGHHVFSILFFPYATLQGRVVLIVMFFVATEATNVGQHLRVILLRLSLEHTKAYVINGVAWAVAFFVMRIVPSPYLFSKLWHGSYAEFSTLDFVITITTVPLPFLLNTYWFGLIFRGVVSFLTKKKGTKAEKKDS
jgi:hypothetical protein